MTLDTEEKKDAEEAFHNASQFIEKIKEVIFRLEREL